MILIVESGSTKTQWVVIKGKQACQSFFTDGINPSVQSIEMIKRIITDQLPASLLAEKISYIFFYGAGCVGERQKKTVRDICKELLNADAKVESDLYAAAKALFQSESGIACILGTGSNSGFYDGENMYIAKTVPSLGYILGDEGSGSVLGRMFLADCLKGLAPDELTYLFVKEYDITYPDILDRVYKQPAPNRFMADFSLFLAKHKDKPYVKELVKSNFRNFFDRCILQYDYKNNPVGFVGSIAFYYSDILRETASEYGVDICKIMQSPTEELVKHHTQYLR